MKIIKTTLSEHLVEKTINEGRKTIDYIDIDSAKTTEDMVGFGGAVTDSAAINFLKMNDKNQKLFLNKVYSSSGLNYNISRLPLGSCDFGVDSYDFLKDDGNIDISYIKETTLKVLKKIDLIRKQKIFVAPWTPPKVFKDNNSYCSGGHLKEDCYEKCAEYYTKTLFEITKLGFDIEYFSVQNEPQAVQVWESCIYSSLDEAKMINLMKEKLLKYKLNNIKLLCWDHNKDVIIKRVQELFINDQIKDIVHGIAYHWYDNTFKDDLKIVKELYHKPLFFTEGCIENFNSHADNKEEFNNAIRYFKNYLHGLKNGTIAFLDWNVLLDEKGGPNHVGNYCEAPVHYDSCSSKLIFNRSYEAIYHFSHYFKDGAKILNIPKDNVAGYRLADGKNIIFILGTKKENITFKIKEKYYNVNVDENNMITLKEE